MPFNPTRVVLPIRPSAIGDAFVNKEQLIEPQELSIGHLYLPRLWTPSKPRCGGPGNTVPNYTYRTSVSLGLVEHFKKYAQSVVDELRIPRPTFVEIGSNDGSLLKAFKALGMKVLGVDPAKTIAETASSERANLPEFSLRRSLATSRQNKVWLN